jgi:hypothetical protein
VFLAAALWLIGRIQYRLNVMDVEDYEPRSSLKVPEHPLVRSRSRSSTCTATSG